MSRQIQTTIEIYGQSFTIRAEPEEEEDLKKVADDVNAFLKQLSRRGTVAIHRLALMAAFQYAYELHTLRNTTPMNRKTSQQVAKKLDKILAKLQAALEED